MAFAEKLESIKAQLQGIDVSNLSLENIGTWPLPIKALAWILVFAGLVFAGHNLIISDMQSQLVTEVAKEETLKQEFVAKAYQAVNLDAYRKQMVEMEESFGALVSQLPSDTEVPGLLEDITNKGESSGLKFQSITLQPEKQREFYIELPISIVATGTYHDMGAFVSGVASLPRIVTLSNFSIKPQAKKGEDSSGLQINITASTYRYKEATGATKKSAKKQAGKKK